MNGTITEFAPLDLERALELEKMLNDAAECGDAVVIRSDGGGLESAVAKTLISPATDMNALVRYQRHYRRGVESKRAKG